MTRPRITAATYWAAISPPRRGHRWIHYASLATTRRESRRLFIADLSTPPYNTWEHWADQGWTIERVTLAPAVRS